MGHKEDEVSEENEDSVICRSTCIVMIVKSRKLRWAEHVARRRRQ
jgi:hypothetical protein